MSTGRTPEQEALFRTSGEVTLDGKLVCFLYLLMRDHVPPGVVGDLMGKLGDGASTFTNGWLAEYAAYLAKELAKDSTEVTVVCPSCRINEHRDSEVRSCRMCGGTNRVRLDQIRPGTVAGFPCPNGCYRGYDPKMLDRPCHTCNDPAWSLTARP